MAIREAAAREEGLEQGESQEQIEEEAEVAQAEEQEKLVVDAFGGGLDHETLMRYDQMAHHVAARAKNVKVAQAEHIVRNEWDPLHEQYHEDWTALRGLETIKGHVISPVLEQLMADAKHDLEYAAENMLRDGMVGQGKSRDEVQTMFCSHVSSEITGAEYHPIAMEVYERLLAPVNKEPEPAAEVQEEQQGKAEEQVEEEEEKQQE